MKEEENEHHKQAEAFCKKYDIKIVFNLCDDSPCIFPNGDD